MPEEFAATMHSSIMWEPKENVLRIAADISSDEWLAIFLNHELSHVYDFLFGGENPNDEKQWIDGEIKAHQLECQLIEKWMADAYDKLIVEGLPLWRAEDKKRLIDLGRKLFPPPSSSDYAQTLAQAGLLACIAFEDAKRKEGDYQSAYRKLESMSSSNMAPR
ncbi:hypothetical protein HYV58_01060 [Candidatus Peregrinibacteria bacterium]|nr:hypothetical protein [Candidatus Peregrinibacteria bacterium]